MQQTLMTLAMTIRKHIMMTRTMLGFISYPTCACKVFTVYALHGMQYSACQQPKDLLVAKKVLTIQACHLL